MEILKFVLLDWFGGALVSLLPTLIMMYFIDKNRFSKKWGWIFLFVFYINAMFIIIGMPDSRHINWNPSINLIPFNDFSSSNIMGMFLNILLFVPYGFFVTIYFKRFRVLWRMLLSGLGLSCFIEILQLFTFRASDVDDLIMNTIGTLAGYGTAIYFFRKMKNNDSESEDRDGGKLLLMLIINVLAVFFIRYPLIEALSQ